MQSQTCMYKLQAPNCSFTIYPTASKMATIFNAILLFSSLFFIATAQSRLPNITLNCSLSPTTKPTSWISSFGHFVIGFYPRGDGFAVGVWLVVPSGNRVIVWTANRDDVPVSGNSSLLLTSDGKLSFAKRWQRHNHIKHSRVCFLYFHARLGQPCTLQLRF